MMTSFTHTAIEWLCHVMTALSTISIQEYSHIQQIILKSVSIIPSFLSAFHLPDPSPSLAEYYLLPFAIKDFVHVCSAWYQNQS
jgi:hypothetical protein